MKNEETLFLFAKAIKSLIKKQPLDKIICNRYCFNSRKNQTNILSTFSR